MSPHPWTQASVCDTNDIIWLKATNVCTFPLAFRPSRLQSFCRAGLFRFSRFSGMFTSILHEPPTCCSSSNFEFTHAHTSQRQEWPYGCLLCYVIAITKLGGVYAVSGIPNVLRPLIICFKLPRSIPSVIERACVRLWSLTSVSVHQTTIL